VKETQYIQELAAPGSLGPSSRSTATISASFRAGQPTVTMRLAGILLFLISSVEGISVDQRRKVVQAFNVRRNASSDSTPLQVGNGNFAFGADVTGLQTFKPYGILSTWCWHNFSLPTTPGQTSVTGWFSCP